jgi:hypothetical protein
MPVQPMDNAHIWAAIQADTQYMRSFIQWVNQRYQAYNQNLTTAVMNAASITAGDQAQINAFVGDLNRLKSLTAGTLPADATNIGFDCAALLGLL